MSALCWYLYTEWWCAGRCNQTSAIKRVCVSWLVPFQVLARIDNFGDMTWVGKHMPLLEHESKAAQYLISLYWSAVTAATVGYGDVVCQPPSYLWLVVTAGTSNAGAVRFA